MKIKRILLSVVLVLSMLIGMAVPVSAAGQPTLIVTCDTESINVGAGTADVVYTISLDPNGTKVAAFQFDLKAPAGMTLSENKLKPAVSNKGGDGYWLATKELKYNEDEETGIFDTMAYSTINNRCAAFGGLGERVLKNTAVIMTIKATVAIDQVKDYTMAVEGFLCFGTGAVDLNALNPVVVPTVSVVSADTPATGITLDKTALEMLVGDTVTLTATVTPATATDKTVTWSSSDTSVVTVDNGKIKAVGKGKATITAKTVNNKTAACEVTVYSEISVPTAISGLIYNGSEQIGVAEGTGYTLSGHKATNAGSYTATATPKSGYKWADGTTTAKTISWKIDKKTVTPIVEVPDMYKYTGKPIIPTVVVKDGTKVIPATEYNVNFTNNTNAGTAKITVTNKEGGNYVIESHEELFMIDKGTQNQPSGLNGVAPSIDTASDGKITGVTNKMEYRKPGDTTWKACTGTEITGLAAGTYEVRFKENDNQTASAATQVVISKGATSVSVPTAISGLIYNTSEQIGVAEGTGYTLSGHKATNAGSYTATATLKSGYKWADGTTTAKTISWKIDKKTVAPIVEAPGKYKYTGKPIIPTVVVKDGTKVIPETEYNVNFTNNTNAGTGEIIVTNKNGGNYVIKTKEESFMIERGTQNQPSGLNGVAPSIDTASDGKITGVTDKMEYRKVGETTWKACTGTEITGLAAGTYEVRFKENRNQTASAATQVVISKGATSVSVPTAISGLIYNTSEQIGVAEGTGYTLSGHKATNAGSYTATATLKSGYKWADGTATAKTISWKIDKKTVYPNVVAIGMYKYTGEPIIPTVMVKYGTKVIPETEYNLNFTDNINAGSAKIIVTNKEGGNYVIESREVFFMIDKGTQNQPSGLNGVAPVVVGESTGKITGVTDQMEYRKAGETTWRDCTGTEITGLAAGDYEIRMKATANTEASAITTVTVRARININTDSADHAYEEAVKNQGKNNAPTGGELVIISTVAVSIILLSSLIVFLAIVASKKKKSVR